MSPLLRDAAAVYVGDRAATAVYMRSEQVWPAPPGVHLFADGSTFPDQAVDSNPYSLGTEFWVVKPALLTRVRYLQPTVGTLVQRTMALYSTTDGTTGIKVGGDWAMPDPVAGEWCEFELPTPVPLTAYVRYRIATLHPVNAGFARTLMYFWNGGAGEGAATTVLDGVLVRPNHTDVLTTSQGSFAVGASIAFPTSAYQYASYYSDVKVVKVPAELRVVADYHGAASASHAVPLAATAPGRDLLAIVHAPAVITLPAGWSESRIYLSSTHIGVWRLPAALHIASLTSLAVSLSGSRQASVVVLEDDMADFYETVTSQALIGGDTTWSTGLRTTAKKVLLAVHTGSRGSAAMDGDSTGYTNGFTALADTGLSSGAVGDESVRTYVAAKEDASLVGAGVTLSLSPAQSSMGVAYAGVIGWNRVASPAAVGLNLFSGTPALSHDANDLGPVTVGTEFSVVAAAHLTKIRYLQATNGGPGTQRVCGLFTVDGASAGTLVAGPFTMPTPINGAWCEYTLVTPYALTINQRYRVAVLHPNGYYAYYPGNHYFDAGGPGAANALIGGVLYRPSSADVVGNQQGAFNYSGSLEYPFGTYNSGCYFSDVVVVPD